MYNKLVTSRYLDNYGLYIILGLIFGLQIVMVGPLSVRIPTTPFSIAFRALMLALSAFLCLRVIFFPKRIKMDTGMVWLLAFFLIYSLRFMYDMFILDIDISPRLGGASRLSQMMFGSIIIPLLGISVVRIKKPNLGKFIFYASLLQSLAILYIFFVLYGASMEAFVSRYYVSSIFHADDLGNPIGPIVISRAGGILAIVSLLVRGINGWVKLVCFGLGIALLLLGSSRGPLVAFGLCFLIIAYTFIRRGGFEVIALKIIGIGLLSAFIILAMNFFMVEINLGSVNRLMGMLDSGGQGEERLYTWTAAWEQFKSSPVLGDKIVENYSNTYPHNIILEILMSVGLLGFIPFLIANYLAIRKFFSSMKGDHLIVGLLFIYLFIGVLVSGSIVTSPDYWMAFFLLLCLRK